MFYCKALEKEFATKEELFSELKRNESKILSLKKAQKYESALKGQVSSVEAFLKPESATKAGLQTKSGFVYPVINTTKYMDAHDDVHFDGLWTKTLKEQEGKIYYVANHSLKIDDVIAWPEDVKAFVAKVDWRTVGKDYDGQTEALIFEIPEDKIQKESALKAIKDRRKVQGSVSMIYVKIMLGIDSNEKDYAPNKAFFDAHINEIANKEKVMEQGYFFGVTEARIYKEGSLVLAGSNDATEMIYPEPDMEEPDEEDDDEMDNDEEKGCRRKPKKIEPLISTQTKDNDPSKDSQSEIYEFLIKNLKSN